MTSEAERPNPDALLQAARDESRGRLKIFLGAAPGVGKTYAMLQAAQRARADGVAVLVGVVETHGRAETEALLQGLEVLPRRDIPYRGRSMTEFDLDAALARKPGLLLVDELAHSNVPGSRHPKRYQDVEELLAAGIAVWTTLNIQHLESFNDIVAQITRVRVRETLPDSVIERADELVLIDVTPDELIKRLKEGKVYIPAQAEQAMGSFFQPGNLTALRELALRRTAERVDSQMVNYMRQHAIAGPWPAGERIVVCISAHPDPMRLVRAGRRLAAQLDAKWTALYVETPAHARLSDEERDRIAAALRLAEYLGGDARTVPGTDLIDELRRFARNNNVTQLVLGKSRRSRWRELMSRSLVHELLRQDDGINIHVVSAAATEDEARAARLASLRRPAPGWIAYAASVAAVAVAGFVAYGLDVLTSLDPPALSIVFLAAVLYSALTFGLLASIFASLLSVLAYNFFFLPPLYDFTIRDPQNVLALIAFLIVAIFTSNLAGRTREQARATRRRLKTAAALYDFSRKLAATHALDDLLWAVSHQVASALGAKVVVLMPTEGRIAIRAGYPPDDRLDDADWAAANWAWEKGEPAGYGSNTMPNAARLYFPMRTGRGVVGVLGVQIERGKGLLEPEQRRMLEALLDQAAVAIERAMLDREMEESRVLAETDKLRTALLSSLSHDLRTPLTSILGAATTLRSKGGELKGSARDGLLEDIEVEAQRLNQFVGNLLDMTRLEAGALVLKRDWADLRELVGSAVARARPRLGTRAVEIGIPGDMPLVRVDFTLMQQVLYNVLDNAAKYSPENTVIRIDARREKMDAVIEISDEGIGINPADLERVFDKFYRVSGGDRQVAGTGLGLAICRGIVEAHGGAIRAASPAAQGRGTRITLRLPVESQPSAALSL
jgi:two-component system sensor histidine kinase KdpD